MSRYSWEVPSTEPILTMVCLCYNIMVILSYMHSCIPPTSISIERCCAAGLFPRIQWCLFSWLKVIWTRAYGWRYAIDDYVSSFLMPSISELPFTESNTKDNWLPFAGTACGMAPSSETSICDCRGLAESKRFGDFPSLLSVWMTF